MKSAPNVRRWLVPGAWLATAAVAFSIGRMSSWLEEPVVPGGSQTNAAGAVSATGGGPGSDSQRPVFSVAPDAENRQVITIGEVTGGQPLEDWLKKLMAQDDDIYRMQHFVRLFEALNSVEDLKAALAVINADGGRGGGRGGMRFTEYSMLLQKLTQLNPKEAVAFASGKEGGERWMATGTVLRQWTKMEPDAALAWAKENGAQQVGDANDDNRRTENWALASVVTQMAKTNLDKALTEAATADFGRGGGRTADALVGELVNQRGADEAKKAALSIPEGGFRNQFIEQLADRLSSSDPKGTMAWVSELPAGESRRRALGEVMPNYLSKDPQGAIELARSLPVSPDNDSARQPVAVYQAKSNLDEAMKTISAMADPGRQQRVVFEIARDLARRDVNTGQQFVLQSPLADETKAQLAQQITQARNRDSRGGGGQGGFRGRPN